jgi:adenylate kinase
MRIIIVGPPGSGKTTIGSLLSEKLKIPFISTGNLLRKNEEIKKIIESGKLVDSETVCKIVYEEIKNLKDFILEGFPRKVEESKFLIEKIGFDYIFYIFEEKNELIERLKNRYFCPKCLRIYNLKSNKPKNDLICDFCNVKLEKRKEDEEEKIKIRFEEFEKETLPAIKILKNNTKNFFEIRNKNVEKTLNEILQILKV